MRQEDRLSGWDLVGHDNIIVIKPIRRSSFSQGSMPSKHQLAPLMNSSNGNRSPYSISQTLPRDAEDDTVDNETEDDELDTKHNLSKPKTFQLNLTQSGDQLNGDEPMDEDIPPKEKKRGSSLPALTNHDMSPPTNVIERSSSMSVGEVRSRRNSGDTLGSSYNGLTTSDYGSIIPTPDIRDDIFLRPALPERSMSSTSSKTILISYVRKEAEAHAKSLKAELVDLGLDVYLDVDEIKVGHDWAGE